MTIDAHEKSEATSIYHHVESGALGANAETVPSVDQRSEQQSRIMEATLSSIADFVYTLDREGRFLYVNQPLLDLWGRTSQDMIGKTFLDLQFPPDIAEQLQANIQEVLITGKKVIGESPYVTLAGLPGYCDYIFAPVIGKSGVVDFVVGTSRDITIRNSSDKHLAQMEARYRGLLEAAPDAMLVVDQAGGIVLLNAQAEKQFGYSRDDLLNKKVKSIIPEGFAERLIADGSRTTAEALAQQIGTGIELLGLRKDGTVFPIEIMLSPLESPEGILVTAAVRNITLRKAAERQLAQTEARYRGLLEAAPDAMVVVDEVGGIVLLNAQAEKNFGYSRNELLGRDIKGIIPEGFAERLIADAQRSNAEASDQQIGAGIELLGRRKDGSCFPIELMLSPLQTAEGILITAAIRDISERKRVARQLQQSQKMEAVGQLTGGIAHDFNNLLTVIIGNLGLLDRLVCDNEAAIKRVRTAQKAAARGADITRRLLVFATNNELIPGLVSVEDSIQNMIEMASRGLGSDITITSKFESSLPPIFVDVAGLESALLNLVVNARDAMPHGGSIIVSSELHRLLEDHPVVRSGDLKAGQYVRINVTDTGQGMSRKTLESACEPFFTTKPSGKGTGLGLAMVCGFAKKSGGTVRIDSELEIGTTVSFYLPIAEAMSCAELTLIPDRFEGGLGRTVLVVDDDSDVLEIAVIYLTEMGFKAIQAKDGAAGLVALTEHGEVDLLVTDIAMPGGMNGADLAQRARLLHPSLKVVYSSGFPAEVLAKGTTPLLEGPLLRKPFQRDELAQVIHRVMRDGVAAASRVSDVDRRS